LLCFSGFVGLEEQLWHVCGSESGDVSEDFYDKNWGVDFNGEEFADLGEIMEVAVDLWDLADYDLIMEFDVNNDFEEETLSKSV
jgi:hypothetical protein